MQTQKGLNGKIEHRKYFIGAHPIIQTFIERLKVSEIIGAYIKQVKTPKLLKDLRLQCIARDIGPNQLRPRASVES